MHDVDGAFIKREIIMARDYLYTADGRKFAVVQRRARDMMLWKGRGNPLLWFSWEISDGAREWLACGVKTKREAEQPINEICGITG